MKTYNSRQIAVLICMVMMLSSCAMIQGLLGKDQLNEEKQMLIQDKKKFVALRTELITTSKISDERIKNFFNPTMKGLNQQLNILLRQAKQLENTSDEIYPQWKKMLVEFHGSLEKVQKIYEKGSTTTSTILSPTRVPQPNIHELNIQPQEI